MARGTRRSGFEFDDDELATLEADFRRAPLRARLNVTKQVEAGARLMDREMRVDARGHRYLRNLPDAVSHEMLSADTAEIGLGPTSAVNDQGSIAHIIVHGSVNNAPVYDHMAGPRRALPRIEQGFADAAEDAVFGKRGDMR